ncbi:hypothetical protein UlMin_042382 [Ulmus minor]
MTTPSNKKLQGKVAIIIGGVSGIGEAIALRFADHGALAVVIANVQDEKGQNLSPLIGHYRSIYIHCDVTDEEQVKSLVETTVRTYGRLDIMFSNTGVSSRSDQKVLDIDLTALEKLYAINIRGTAACVKHAACAMVEGGIKGSIICTASKFVSFPGLAVYTDYVSSKWAVMGLMKSASLQLNVYGIRVNLVSPRLIITPMSCEAFNKGEEEMRKLSEKTAYLKKGKVLSAENVAEGVAFLASKASEFVTRHDLAVDGGLVFIEP